MQATSADPPSNKAAGNAMNSTLIVYTIFSVERDEKLGMANVSPSTVTELSGMMIAANSGLMFPVIASPTATKL